MDLVIGKGHSGAPLIVVERKTRFTLSTRVDDKSAKTVTAATISLWQPFNGPVLTITADNVKEFAITADNGKEFTYHEGMTEYFNCGTSFAYPYYSWQRGLNENTNGLLRL